MYQVTVNMSQTPMIQPVVEHPSAHLHPDLARHLLLVLYPPLPQEHLWEPQMQQAMLVGLIFFNLIALLNNHRLKSKDPLCDQ